MSVSVALGPHVLPVFMVAEFFRMNDNEETPVTSLGVCAKRETRVDNFSMVDLIGLSTLKADGILYTVMNVSVDLDSSRTYLFCDPIFLAEGQELPSGWAPDEVAGDAFSLYATETCDEVDDGEEEDEEEESDDDGEEPNTVN